LGVWLFDTALTSSSFAHLRQKQTVRKPLIITGDRWRLMGKICLFWRGVPQKADEVLLNVPICH
jgi:hypothetical protein